MNQEQVLGILRIVLPSILAFFVGKGWIAADTAVADLTTAIVTIAAAVWSGFVHTQRNAAAVVAAMPSTEVKSDRGNVSITLHDEAMGHAAAMNATPYVRT